MSSAAIGSTLETKEHLSRRSESSAGLSIFVVLYLLAIVTPATISFGSLNMTMPRLYLIVVLVPILASFFQGKYGKMLGVDFFFGLHVLWIAVALSVNNPNMVVTQVGSLGVEFAGGYLLARAFIQTPEAFIALCRWIIFIVLCTMPFSVFEAFTGRPLIIEAVGKLPGLQSFWDSNRPQRIGLERAQSVFVHPIHYGLFCSVAFSLAFVALKGLVSPTRRYVISLMVMFTGFLALSSGALLAMLLQLGLIFWAALFDKVRWRWWLLLGLGCLAYIVIDILSNRSPVTAVLTRTAFSSHNVYWRMIIFEWGMKNVWDNPIFGIGLNDWERPHFMHSGSMDNFWLVMAVRYGIPGVLFLALGYFLGLFQVMRRNFDTDPVLLNARLAWVFTFIGLSFTLCTVHVWVNIYSFVFFMFGAGMWFITTKPRSGEAAVDEADEQNDRSPLPYTRFSRRQTNRMISYSGPNRQR